MNFSMKDNVMSNKRSVRRFVSAGRLEIALDYFYRFVFLSIIYVLLLLVRPGVSFAQNPDQVIILMSQSGGSYQAFVDSFSETYSHNDHSGFDAPITSLSISDSFPSGDVLDSKNTLLVTVGTKAAQHVAAMTLDMPIIHAMLPYSTYQNIYGEQEACAARTAIYIDQPIKRQLNLAKEIFPDLQTYGFLLGEVSSKRYQIEKELYGLSDEKIASDIIHESRELAWSLRNLSEQAKVFIAINDPLIFNPNNAKWILYMAYQKQRPIIGFSMPYVSAGASAAVYTTPSQLGRQTAELVFEQQGKSECLFKPQYPRYFNVGVNNAVIQSLSGKLLDESYLLEQLQKLEGGQ